MGLEHVRSNACSGHPPVSGGVFGAVKPAATGSFVCLGLVSSLRSIRIRVVLTDDWHFARNLAGLRAGDSAIICSVCFCSQHQVRSLWAPTITNAELDGFNVTLFKQLCEFRLVPIGEKPDGP